MTATTDAREAANEAAAAKLYDLNCVEGWAATFNDLTDFGQEGWRADARDVLDAALPVLLDGLDRDALAEVIAHGVDDPTNAGADWADNTADAVLAHLRDVWGVDHG